VRSLRDAYLLQRALPWTSGLDGAPHVGPHGLPPDALLPLAPPAGLSAYRHVSYLECAFYLRNQLLHDADVMSAAHSVELRVPFLDPAVLRAAWALPPSCHTGRRGDGKRVLRALLTALDPAHPPAAGKRGFVLPWTSWMRGALGERVAATVCDRSRLEAMGLPPDLGRNMLGAFRRGGPEADWSSPWALFTLLEWQERARLAP
jgi:asparagine synthase (glutamine-hydrolysing)